MNDIHIKNKRCKIELLENKFPNALILDITSRAVDPWKKLSPFYPHTQIPIAFSYPETAFSVEGIWQGLKVFENTGIDTKKFYISSMRGIKRTTRKHGAIRGHQKGVFSKELLDYETARLNIYIPTYLWTLKHLTSDLVSILKDSLQKRDVVLLDYQSNEDIFDPSSPISHAAIIKMWIKKQLADIEIPKQKSEEIQTRRADIKDF